jgi:peptidoglycan hydrolase CwlO-like protein
MNSKVNEFDSQLQKVGEQITSSNSKVNELKLQLQRVEKQLANLSEILQKLVMPINISSVFLR